MKIVSGEPKSADLPRILMAYGTFPPSQRLFHLEPNMVNWAHRWIGDVLRALGVRLPGLRRRVKKSLDDLDREICNARLPNTADSPEERLDVDALASTEEVRLIIGLHLDGWTWHEINNWLRNR
jgi:hypothetical protein